ncbi:MULTISPECIES: MaoC family dehydratase [Acinetobacter]|uniref:MaoC family dehydratase n=1 Tax=Acinetobacter TaxID=469 RepID=UPI0015D12962|nr:MULTISPECIES: MaoC family dehydratase [Acinetobacter]MCU4611627.1 MaoC family dehydratase [Acinetobacter parvus]
MLSIAEYKVGMCAEIVRSFSENDVDLFSKLSGDENPVHLNEEYAKTTLFGRRIVHGALASSIFSALFANKLPGAGCIYLKFENKFLRPIYLNEKVIFKVEIIDILQEKKRVIFKTVAVSNDQECIMGMAELYIPE